MPTMPDTVGLQYEAALLSMVNAGVRVLPLGYFQTDPVSIAWVPSVVVKPNFVISQNPASGNTVSANSSVVLTVSEPPMGVVYPGGGSNI